MTPSSTANEGQQDNKQVSPGMLSLYFQWLFWGFVFIVLDINQPSFTKNCHSDGLLFNNGITAGYNTSLIPDFIGVAFCICAIRGLARFTFASKPPRYYRLLLRAAEGIAWIWLFNTGGEMLLHDPVSPIWSWINTAISIIIPVGVTCFLAAVVQLCDALTLNSKKWWITSTLIFVLLVLWYLTSLSPIFLMLGNIAIFGITIVVTCKELDARFERDNSGTIPRATEPRPSLLFLTLIFAAGIGTHMMCQQWAPYSICFPGDRDFDRVDYNEHIGNAERRFRLYNTNSESGKILAFYAKEPDLLPREDGSPIKYPPGFNLFFDTIKVDAVTGEIQTPDGPVTMDAPFVLFYTTYSPDMLVRVDIPRAKQLELAALVRSKSLEVRELVVALDEYLPKPPVNSPPDITATIEQR